MVVEVTTHKNSDIPVDDIGTLHVTMSKYNSSISEHYKNLDYEAALEQSLELMELTDKVFGEDGAHPAIASSRCNAALMNKMLRRHDAAKVLYDEALELYKASVGINHLSYASTLNNMGVLLREMGEEASGIQKLEYYELSFDHFEKVLEIRTLLMTEDENGGDLNHPNIITTKYCLGGSLFSQAKYMSGKNMDKNKEYASVKKRWSDAEMWLRDAFVSSRVNNKETNEDGSEANYIQTLVSASAANNLGVFLKTQDVWSTGGAYVESDDLGVVRGDPEKGALKEARMLLEKSLEFRSTALWIRHPDFVSGAGNLAELYDYVGLADDATKLRKMLMKEFGITGEEEIFERS
jgi:tetratricopeptide (TPR) repeat protein